TGYSYNHNIHPYREFKKRLATAREFAEKVKLPLIVDKSYELEMFLANAMVNIEGRCVSCHEVRLRKAAQVAKENGFDAFTTSLLVSPYQKHDLIRAVGEKVAREEGIEFFYQDFREGWQEGVDISLALELYRQPYCGCIFSEKERYWKPPKNTQK
ncbi:MAG: epoxyqueuosine reductase QueH, partial [Selenomonadales bacterium]|nr:epoxyqueuosine reductase QueH [Selenomonadales bacterium]